MKIELKLNSDSILAVSDLLQHLYDLNPSIDKKEKVYRSIGLDLADKFDTKSKSIKKKVSLFDAQKKHKISLKYHEAWALEIILTELCTLHDNDYNRFRVNLVLVELNAKLA